MRVGTGFDIHKLVKKRKLILGGVHVPFVLGLEGHSDGDVLVHSICDALLGAAAQRDMGYHFPNIPRYKNISSLVLLRRVRDRIKKYYSIVNIDTTLVIERPRLSEYIEKMRKKIAGILGMDVSQVSVKCTTSKKIGLIGKEKAVASFAVASLKDIEKE